MSDPETMPAGVHPEVALLPWYANGTLGEQEREQVARHLESCADCRRELDDLRQMKRNLTAMYHAQPEPSPLLARSVMAKVATERPAGAVRRSGERPWLIGIDQWLRSLLLPQWVPTLVSILLIVQAGLLLWTAMPSTQQDQVTSRSVGSPAAKLSVVFQEHATEAQIRALLTMIQGRVIDGPRRDQAYIIEVVARDPAVSMKALETLRTMSDLVRTAEVAAP